MSSAIKSPYGDIKSPYDTVGVRDTAPTEPETPEPVEAPKKQGFWGKLGSRIGSDAMEPVRLATETVLAPVNAVRRGAQGLKGMASGLGAYAGGATTDEALMEANKALGPRDDIKNPFGASKTSEYLGENVVNPLANQARKIPGVGDYVDPILEAGGDIASLFGVKPGIAAVKGVGTGAFKAVAGTQAPERLYASAAKMPLSKAWTKELGPEAITKRKEAVRAGLEGEVPINDMGIQKAKNLEKEFRGKVDGVIADLDATGVLIPKDKLKAGLAGAYEVAGIEGTAAAERIVNNLYNRFEKKGQLVKTGEQQIPAVYEITDMGDRILKSPARIESIMERQYKPSEIQAIKRHLYKMENYERMKLSRGLGSQLKELGNKGMAREAKVALEELFPDLKKLNRQDAAYVNLVDALERAVPRLQNKDIMGLGTKVLLTGAHPVMGIVEHIVGLPAMKGRLAFALNRARKSAPMTGVPTTMNAAGAIGAGLAQTTSPKYQEPPTPELVSEWLDSPFEESAIGGTP